MRRMVFSVALAAMMLAAAPKAHAFCGFYVGKAGSKLFNELAFATSPFEERVWTMAAITCGGKLSPSA